MKFRYIGDSDAMQVFGYDFRDGKTPEVTDDNALMRLSGNRFFEAVKEEAGESPTPVADAPVKVRQKPGRKPRKG